MEKDAPGWTLTELAQMLGGTVSSNGHYLVKRPVPADSDDAEGIAFCESEPYLEKAHSHGVGALILPYTLHSNLKPVIHVEHPRVAFGRLLAMSQRPLPIREGIHETAVVHPSAFVDESASVGPYVVIEEDARVGEKAKIHAFCYVGEGCSVGAGAILYPHVVLYQDVEIGEKTIVHSGVVMGADGFGFMWDGNTQHKVPQVGRVQIGNRAEIGANTTIDRATAGTTSVGDGTKIDNQVQVGHNVSIGKDGVIAGQSGISGSVRIGDRMTMGGQCAIRDHVTITDDVTLAGASGVGSDILTKGAYFGRPAVPASEGLRAFMLAPKLPELFSRVRALERKINELEDKGE